MKIGILSMQRVYNYGSVLQAYALRQMIEAAADETAEFLDPNYGEFFETDMPVQDLEDYPALDYYYRGKLYYWAKKVIDKLLWYIFKWQMKRFQKDELALTKRPAHKKYDIVVEGSDEVFKAAKRVYMCMYGRIDGADKLITYAASCGSAVYEGIPKEQLPELIRSMKNFSAMSVRDEGTAAFIKHLYPYPIERHMDPVLMGGLYRRKHPVMGKRNYIIVYAYGDRIRTKEEICAIRQFASAQKMKLIALGGPQYWCDSYKPVSPFKLLDLFFNAEYVITDTFHGAIFSIIHHCRFAVLLRKSNQNKLSDLLFQMELEDRIAASPAEICSVLERDIDYVKIDRILEREQIRAAQYLKTELAVNQDNQGEGCMDNDP